MRIPNLVLLLTFSVLLIASFPYILHAVDPAECATCEELINAPNTGIFVLVNDIDDSNRYLNIVAFYENLSASPSRQPLKNTIVLVELTSPTGTYVLQKTYTDDNGTAKFRYSSYDAECLNFKVLYCPFCVPPEVECEGFKQCVEFGRLDTSATNADGITTATDAVVPADLNTVKYLPSLGTASWCPPPPKYSATPALCFPLILIFSLLSGALYLTGRNPFAGFNIGGMRTGQHIRYQARGRGFSFSFTQLAMAAMSVGEAAKTASKQGGGALVKREKDAANARGIGGVWSHNAGGGKSGFVPTISTSVGQYQAGRAAAATAETAERAGGRGGQGAGASGVSGRGGASMSQTAGGMQTGLTGGQGVSGRDIIGGSTVFNATSLLRIVAFIAVNTTLGRAIDACYSAATWNAQAGRGSSMFEGMFADRNARIVDAAATLSALRGPNNGMMISVDTGTGPTLVEVIGQPRTVTEGEPPRTLTTYTIAAPAGNERGQTTDGRIQVTLDSNGQVARLQMQVFVPARDAQGAPVMTDGVAQGTRETVRILPPAEAGGAYTIQRETRDPATGNLNFTTVTPTTTGLPPYFQDYVTAPFMMNMPVGFSPGLNASMLQDSYSTHVQGVQALQQTIQTETAFEMERRADAVASGLGSSPETRDAVQSTRYDVAAEGVATLGIPLDDVRLGGTGELMTGVERGSSDLDGHTRSQQEAIVLAVHGADESAGPRLQGIPSLTSLASGSGVHSLAVASGIDPDRAGEAVQVLTPILGQMTVGELTTMNQSDLAARIVATNATRADQGLPPITQADAMAFAAVASSVRSIATEFTGTLSSTPGFTGTNTDTSGRTLLDRVNSTDLSALATVSNAGHLVSSEGTAALLTTRPEVIGSYRVSDDVAQAAREYVALDQVYRSASSGDPVASIGLVNDALFNYGTAVMVNTARGTEGALQDSEYGQATRGLDSGAHYANLTAEFGDLPSRSPLIPGLPPGTVPSIESTEIGRRTQIETYVSSGDFGTARASIGEAVRDYTTAARAARALGDDDAARTLETAAQGYSQAYSRIDAAEGDWRSRGGVPSPGAGAEVTASIATYFPVTAPPTPPPPPPTAPADSSTPPTAPPPPPPPPPTVGSPIPGTTLYTVVDSATVATTVSEVRMRHGAQRTDDMIEVKEHIMERLPADKRPPELYDQARAMPLTPTVHGLGQTERDTG